MKSIIVLEEEEKKKKKENYFSSNNQSYNCASELPHDLLHLVFDRVSLGDYATFGAVCRTWRSLDVGRKQESLASQQPLLFFKPKGTNRSCQFLNIFGGTNNAVNSKTVLPHAYSIYCTTFCCGYFIAYVDKTHQLWLLNPITRNIYIFPFAKYPIDRFIIASSSSSSIRPRQPWPYSPDDLVTVGVNWFQEYIQFYRSKDAKWTILTYGTEPGEIVDIVNFKGKIYFLTNTAGIGIINLPQDQDGREVLVRLEVHNKGSINPPSASRDGYCLELVASDEWLMMVVFLELKVVSVYEFDFSKMEWRRVEERLDVEDEVAIFTGNLDGKIKSSALVKNPSRWGGQSNCIYSFDAKANCTVYSLGGEVLQTFPFPINLPLPYSRPVWYFPHQSNIYGTIDFLYEN